LFSIIYQNMTITSAVKKPPEGGFLIVILYTGIDICVGATLISNIISLPTTSKIT
jgi:hypothetical protein